VLCEIEERNMECESKLICEEEGAEIDVGRENGYGSSHFIEKLNFFFFYFLRFRDLSFA
jgi:hypothetical protein